MKNNDKDRYEENQIELKTIQRKKWLWNAGIWEAEMNFRDIVENNMLHKIIYL